MWTMPRKIGCHGNFLLQGSKKTNFSLTTNPENSARICAASVETNGVTEIVKKETQARLRLLGRLKRACDCVVGWYR